VQVDIAHVPPLERTDRGVLGPATVVGIGAAFGIGEVQRAAQDRVPRKIEAGGGLEIAAAKALIVGRIALIDPGARQREIGKAAAAARFTRDAVDTPASAAGLQAQLLAVGTRAGDDIHNPRDGIGAVHRRGRPAHDLDAFDSRWIEGGEIERATPVVGWVVQAHTVEQNEGLVRIEAAGVDRSPTATRAWLLHVNSGNVAQHVHQAGVVGALDLLARDHADRPRRSIRGHGLA
jgi:hypothetical protein